MNLTEVPLPRYSPVVQRSVLQDSHASDHEFKSQWSSFCPPPPPSPPPPHPTPLAHPFILFFLIIFYYYYFLFNCCNTNIIENHHRRKHHRKMNIIENVQPLRAYGHIFFLLLFFSFCLNVFVSTSTSSNPASALPFRELIEVGILLVVNKNERCE